MSHTTSHPGFGAQPIRRATVIVPPPPPVQRQLPATRKVQPPPQPEAKAISVVVDKQPLIRRKPFPIKTFAIFGGTTLALMVVALLISALASGPKSIPAQSGALANTTDHNYKIDCKIVIKEQEEGLAFITKRKVAPVIEFTVDKGLPQDTDVKLISPSGKTYWPKESFTGSKTFVCEVKFIPQFENGIYTIAFTHVRNGEVVTFFEEKVNLSYEP